MAKILTWRVLLTVFFFFFLQVFMFYWVSKTKSLTEKARFIDSRKRQGGGNWPKPSIPIPQPPSLSLPVLPLSLNNPFFLHGGVMCKTTCSSYSVRWGCTKPICCLSLYQIFMLSSTDVTTRGDETSNTVMKELFSWHSTLKPEDAFPARTWNDKARQNILDANLATVCFPLKDINIYVHIL